MFLWIWCFLVKELNYLNSHMPKRIQKIGAYLRTLSVSMLIVYAKLSIQQRLLYSWEINEKKKRKRLDWLIKTYESFLFLFSL